MGSSDFIFIFITALITSLSSFIPILPYHQHWLLIVHSFPHSKDASAQYLDEDGLPPIGLYVEQGDIIYGVLDQETGRISYKKHESSEPAYIDEVRILDGDREQGVQKVSIKYRYNRNPVVGDKFSSRHGQKGVLSVLWPHVDMPFTGSGITPDCIINPNAFPSRMTIGMLIESMAGKSGALHGKYMDATPFKFSEKQRAVDYFGEQLKAAGFNYYGSEPLYSGIWGEKMEADIYIGVVYYQRLRHMVSDKSQVRATGPINQLTRQPLKGRKKHGGIRFGEVGIVWWRNMVKSMIVMIVMIVNDWKLFYNL